MTKQIQKFKKGNIVKVLAGNNIWSNDNGKIETIDIRPSDIGRKAVIEYSYAEKYWGNDVKSYSIMFLDTKESIAWKDESELEFIEEGSEDLLIQRPDTRLKMIKENSVFFNVGIQDVESPQKFFDTVKPSNAINYFWKGIPLGELILMGFEFENKTEKEVYLSLLSNEVARKMIMDLDNSPILEHYINFLSN